MRKTTDVGHGLAGALLVTVVAVVLMLLLAGGLLLGYFGGNTHGFETGIVMVCVLLYLAVAVGVVAALVQRWREVRRGEEDEAKKY